jgi:lysozyme|tara:strand:+ start:140 stop:562 length:423 start_codon:yes stop_codon:yes gene_type:complete
MSAEMLGMLQKHEGFRNKIYLDHLGIETIGVGRNLRDVGLTDVEVMDLLSNDVDRCQEELERTFNWFSSLDQVRQEFLIQMCFNLGLTRLRGFKKALRHMAARAWEESADEFLDSRWSTQVGQRAVELTDLLRTGKYQDE